MDGLTRKAQIPGHFAAVLAFLPLIDPWHRDERYTTESAKVDGSGLFISTTPHVMLLRLFEHDEEDIVRLGRSVVHDSTDEPRDITPLRHAPQ
ncbi:hypothetical protein CMUS01_13386 [Colletotrichum musicola]|uniref:Uncharacterized protein n=1 Tax=Colletotrichum musicola TaxID=2175873 RepID=A0A8H6JDZ6_9PEZI|nr:hypothetical protein CMUS01_13386 [Colletotrichum musicola]